MSKRRVDNAREAQEQSKQEILRALDESFGARKGRRETGEQHVERIRSGSRLRPW